jgi:hypothetical protein
VKLNVSVTSSATGMSIDVVAASCAGVKIPFPFITIDVLPDPQTTLIDELPPALLGSAPALGINTPAIAATATAVVSSNLIAGSPLSQVTAARKR